MSFVGPRPERPEMIETLATEVPYYKERLMVQPGLTGWAWRPIIMITLATIAFALLIDRFGLVAAMLVSMTLTALGTPETRWREYALFAVLMIVIAIAMFIKGLGMPIPIWPTQAPDWIASLLELLRGR